MAPPEDDQPRKGFVTTRWSVVLNAAAENAPERRAALDQLCQDYWPPLYCYALSRGFNSHDSKDLVQGFFERLLQKNYLRLVDREKGRFRAFLIVALKRYILNEFDKRNAIKRGGEVVHVSLDFEQAEHLYSEVEQQVDSPEEVYDRSFALTLIYKVLAQLEAKYVRRDKAKLFQFLRTTLPGQSTDLNYEAAAELFGIRLNTLKSEVHRFRQRFRKQMIAAVGDIVPDLTDVDSEVRYLLQIFQKG